MSGRAGHNLLVVLTGYNRLASKCGAQSVDTECAVGSVGSDFKRCWIQCNALSHLASGSLETPIGWHPILLRIIFGGLSSVTRFLLSFFVT